MSGAQPDLATLAEFAAIARLRPAYVRELRLRGRLVLADDGERVRVRESMERIQDASVKDQIPSEATLSDFAVLAGFRQSYASQLKAEGRLVLTPDGKRVRVSESLALIRDTRDPARSGVVERHQAARGEALNLPAEDLEDEDERDPPEPPAGAGGGHRSAYHEARARREQHMADLAAMDVAARRGELLDRDAVRSACSAAVTQFRTRLEGLAPTLGPQLAPITDEARCTALLADAVAQLLEELERKFRAMTPETNDHG